MRTRTTSSLALYREVIRRMRTYSWSLFAAVLALIFSSIVEAAKPWPLKVVIDNVLRGQPLALQWFSPLSRSELLLDACLMLVAVYLVLGVGFYHLPSPLPAG